MPWNDNANPGPWGSPPSSNDDEPRLKPERQTSRSAPPPPPRGPDVAEIMRRARAEWGRMARGRRAARLTLRLVGLAVAGLAAVWILSGFYIVQPFEAAVVTRLGAFERTEGAGLRFHLPAPIERVQRLDVGHEQRLVIGGDGGSGALGEGSMPTGDGAIVDLDFVVQYRINDPVAWVFRSRDPDLVLRGAAESAMRQAVASGDSTSLLTGGRGPVQAQALALMQASADHDRIGVAIDSVQFQSANPPAAVAPAWQDLARASQDAQAATSAANTYASKTIGDAQAAAARSAQAAVIYQEQVVHEANGEASRFDQIYAQYRRAPAVTRDRIYIQTMEAVLSRAHTVVVGSKGAQIILSPPNSSPANAEPPSAPPSPATPGSAP